MNLSKQIKKYRERDQLSQEELAEKIYVSRQTISNWENERSYPDIHNLLLLSVLFDVSLDELVKGDVDIMRKELKVSEWNRKSNQMAVIMVVFLVLATISVGPVLKYFDTIGLVIPGVLYLIGLGASLRLEKMKKQNNLKTYSEIVAFVEGKQLSEEEREQNKKKDRLYLILSIIAFGVAAGVITGISVWLFL